MSLFLALLPLASAVTLDDAWKAAESKGVEVRLLEEQTIQARARRDQSIALLSPKLVGSGSYTVNEFEVALDPNAMIPEQFQELLGESEPIVVQKKAFFEGAAVVQVPLIDGKAIPTYLAASRGIEAAEASERAQKAQLRAGVAKAYYGVVASREGVSLAEAAVATSEAQLALANQQVAAGVAPPRAALQAELGLAQAKRDLEGARSRRTQVEEVFWRLTGLPRDSALDVPPPVPVPSDLDRAVLTARADRPEVQAAEEQAKAAKYAQRAQDLDWLPSLTGQFSYAYTQNTGFMNQNTIWTLKMNAQWLLWDGGYRLGKEREAASQARQAKLMVDLAGRQAEEAVRVAWTEYTRAQASLASVEREQALAEENLRLAKLGFEAGTTTFLEVQQAELGARLVKVNGVVERMGRDLAAIDLAVATGAY